MKEINIEDKFNAYKSKLEEVEKRIDILKQELETIYSVRSELLGRLLMLQELVNDSSIKTDE